MFTYLISFFKLFSLGISIQRYAHTIGRQQQYD